MSILICGDKNDHAVRHGLDLSASLLAIDSHTCDAVPATERAGLPDAEKLMTA